MLTSLRQNLRLTAQCARLASSFRVEDAEITLTDTPKPKPSYDNLPFGANTSDHMLEIDYSPSLGWSKPRIHPVQSLAIHPTAKVLHYASEVFEGMKCYRCVDNKLRVFRPMENMARMSRSAERAGLPPFDQAELLKCIKKLISIDQEWVPYSDRCSLYIRPTYIGTQASLGVSASSDAKLFVITGPTGPFFPSGMKAVRLYADPGQVRAWPGGCGAYKMGSNYAGTVAIQAQVMKEHNCQQVLWLYGDDHQMTEVGAMNLFVYWVNEDGEKELVTPPLDSGLILPGVTRKSLIEVATGWNEFKVSEKIITMGKFVKALNEGRVKEVFCAGTAAIVCPVGQILYQGEDLNIAEIDHIGELTSRLYKEIHDIHFYVKPHPWMECIEADTNEPLRTVGAN